MRVESTTPAAPFTPTTHFKRFWGHPVAGRLLRELMEEKVGISELAPQYLDFVMDMPLVKVAHLLSMGTISEADVVDLADRINAAIGGVLTK